MNFAFVPMVLVRCPYPLNESVFPKDMLRGMVCGFRDRQAVSLASGVRNALRYKLLCNASSAESFSYSQKEKVNRFAIGRVWAPPG